MPMPGRHKEKIAWLQHSIENRRALWRWSDLDARGRVDDRRAEDLPTFRAGDLKDDQILGIVVAFEGAATTARHNRCGADPLGRVSLEVLAERSHSGHVFIQLIENQTDSLIQE